MFTELYNLETVTIRYFNVFGPRQNPNSQYAAVIPKFITAFLKHEPLTVYGDGKQSRDFTYVDNVVHGNVLAMTAPEVAGKVINVANGSRTTLLQLIAYLEAFTQQRAQVQFLEPRSGDVRHSQADVSRAKALLGFEPLVDVEQGLQAHPGILSVAQWHLLGKDGWEEGVLQSPGDETSGSYFVSPVLLPPAKIINGCNGNGGTRARVDLYRHITVV